MSEIKHLKLILTIIPHPSVPLMGRGRGRRAGSEEVEPGRKVFWWFLVCGFFFSLFVPISDYFVLINLEYFFYPVSVSPTILAHKIFVLFSQSTAMGNDFI